MVERGVWEDEVEDEKTEKGVGKGIRFRMEHLKAKRRRRKKEEDLIKEIREAEEGRSGKKFG